jgi:hypothetical protein
VFTVATTAHIKSLAFESGATQRTGLQFEVSIDELKDYTVFHDCPMSPGTSVTLSLRDDVVIDDTYEQCRHLLIAAAVPIDLVLDGAVEKVPASVPDVTPEMLLGAKLNAMEEDGLHTFQWRGEQSGVDVALGLVFRIEDQRPTFRLNAHTSVISRLNRASGLSTAVCGFHAPFRPSSTCFDLWRVGESIANVKSPQGIEYSLDRGQVLESVQSLKMGRAIAQCIHDGYRAFLRARDAYDPESIYRLNAESELSGGNVFDQYTDNQLSVAADEYPDLLCFRLYEVDPSRTFEQAVVRHVDWNGLQKLSGSCVVAQTTLDFPAPEGQFRGLYPERLTDLAYAAATSIKRQEVPLYLLEADRRASMLFDADPTSTIQTIPLRVNPGGAPAHLVLQRWNLQRMTLDTDRHQIIAKVQGRWTGALYSRNFESHRGVPYAFLGRHRVLIKQGSKLHERCRVLAEQKRFVKLADLVDDLQLHSQGFDPKSVRGLV